MSEFTFAIDLPVQNQWANVDLLRSSVQNCFLAVFSDVDGCQAIAMVTGELLENAVKYGDWSGTGHPFRLRVRGERGHVSVSVENPIKADDPGVATLTRVLTWMGSFSSPADAYRAKLLEIASAPSSTGGLGLIRVAYEGNCRLSADVASGRLCVTADMRF
jgi:hypothetical protein